VVTRSTLVLGFAAEIIGIHITCYQLAGNHSPGKGSAVYVF